jgi:hypothetical protein
MTATYEIYFYDTAGTLQLLLEGWKRLEFHQKLNDAWYANLRMNMSYLDTRLDFFRNDLTRDWIMEVYRRNPRDNSKGLVYEGLHRTLVDQALKSGTIELTLYNSGYTSLLGRRVVIPPSGEEHSVKSGAAETIMKAFVDDQMISATDADRNIAALSNEADAGSGDTAEYSARYTKLSTVIARCAEQGGVDFGIVGDGLLKNHLVPDWEFQVRPTWGSDLTQGNSEGNPPTIFDLFVGNMEIPILSRSGGDEVTTVYVGGGGTGTDRTIAEEENAAAAAISPWARAEAFYDARNEDGSDGLTTQGQAYLSKHSFEEKFTFNILQTDGAEWPKHYALGDIITATYFDQTFSMKIVEMTVVVTAGTSGQIEVINAELENVT